MVTPALREEDGFLPRGEGDNTHTHMGGAHSKMRTGMERKGRKEEGDYLSSSSSALKDEEDARITRWKDDSSG